MTTFKEKFNKKFKFEADAPHSKSEISKLTGIPKKILDEVYDRGIGAHKNNPESVRNVKGVKGVGGRKMGKERWGMGRIYGFVMENPKQIKKGAPDSDLWMDYRLLKHSKLHRGGMKSKHMINMKRFIKEGKSFEQSHKLASSLDKKGKKY